MYIPSPWLEEPEPELCPLQDPALLRIARRLWCEYQTNHQNLSRQPLGVAVNRLTQRAHLLFRTKPILMLHEAFIPFSDLFIEPEKHPSPSDPANPSV